MDDRGRGASAGPSGSLASELIVVFQIALAGVLLVGAGLMVRSFVRLVTVDPGFDADHVLAVRMRLPAGGPWDGTLERQLTERLEALPGVQAFGSIGYLPLDHPGWELSYSTDADDSATSSGEEHSAFVQTVTPGYFRAMGIPLRAGRRFSFEDLAAGTETAIVSQRLADEGWPDHRPLGRTITPDLFAGRAPWPVVGVVGDVRQRSLADLPPPTVYRVGVRHGNFATYGVVRVTGDPVAAAAAVRAAITDVEPRAAILEVTPLPDIIMASVARPRFVRWLLAVLSALATVLAVVGVAGVMSYNTARRTREIGIRMALGASPASVVRLQLAHGLRLAAAGLGLGTLGALAGSRLLGGLLFQTSATEPASFLAAALLVFLTALLACVPAALRAGRTDPVLSLRHD